MSDTSILEHIAQHYLSSQDFNGLPVHVLRREHGLTQLDTFDLVDQLLRSGEVDVMFGDLNSNPHIRADSDVPLEKQLAFLAELGINDSDCLYPTRKYLANRDFGDHGGMASHCVTPRRPW